MNSKKTLVYEALNLFFYYYLKKRDIEKTLSMVTDDIYSLGTGNGEIALNKIQFRDLITSEINTLPISIDYRILNYREKERDKNLWDCICNVEVIVNIEDDKHVIYFTRLTGSFENKEGKILASVLHMSEASIHQDDNEFFPLKYVSENISKLDNASQHELLEIILEMMPGGIIGGYYQKNYPLYIVNDKYLNLTGYETYEEFLDDINGEIINTIHPNDIDFVNKIVDESLKVSNQYELEYRLRKKDNSYIWVYDIGRKIYTAEGKEVILSVVIDISEKVLLNKRLQKEASEDVLTGLYNRKYGIDLIKKELKSGAKYAFMIMDIDNFKALNDIYGHSEGDSILQFIAIHLKNTFRTNSIILRLGGDEFIIFLNKFLDENIIRIKLDNINQKYNMEINKKYIESKSSISFGVVIGDKDIEFDDLYEMADKLLYEMKRNNKGTYKILNI